MLDTLDTGRQRTGDVFRFSTIGITVTPDLVTVPRNAAGYGLVTYASSAGAHGRGGNLIIEARYIAIPNHAPLQVTIDSNASSAVSNGSSGNLSGGVGLVPLPFVGTIVGAFNYLHAGKNAVVPAGSRFVVVPVGSLATKKRCSF